MEVEYQLTTDDLFAVHWRAAYESRRARRSRYLLYLYLFVALFIVFTVPAMTDEGYVISTPTLSFVVPAFIVCALIQWVTIRSLTRRTILQIVRDEKPDKGQLGMHKVVLDEIGVLETTVVGESRTSWAGVDRVEQNDQYICIYTTPAAVHAIPKQAFDNPQQAESFYEFASINQQAAFY